MSVQTSASLPSFDPFVVTAGEPVLEFSDDAVFEIVPGKEIDKFSNDAGDVTLYDNGDYYLVKVLFGGPENWMKCLKDFSTVMAIVVDKQNYDLIVSSMLRMAFSQRIIFFEGFSIHSSCVVKDGRGYLFLGKSGTGKSTHTRLWRQHFPDAWLLNDDNPACRFVDGKLIVYGTPWSGKTKCYKNESVPVGAFVRLSQSKQNLWNSVKGVQAWVAIFPSCALITRDESLYLQSQNTLNRVVSEVRVGQLACLPDEDAVVLCYSNIK